MSLLLKALEKTDEAKESGSVEGQDSATGEQPTPAGVGLAGGIKLARGGSLGGGGSKLGSALSTKESVAKSVSSAYDEDADENIEIVATQRKKRVRDALVAVVFVAVLAVGWFGYMQYIAMNAQDIDKSRSTYAAEDKVIDDLSEDVLLPLSDPIYDIQENILTASVAGSQQTEQQADIVAEVESYVDKILQEQLLRKHQALGVSVVPDLEDFETSQVDEVIKRLEAAKDFNWEEAEILTSDVKMMAQLEALASRSYQNQNNKQFVRKHGLQEELVVNGDLAQATASDGSDGDTADGMGDDAMQKKKKKEKDMVITPNIITRSSGLDKVMDRAVVQYRASNFSAAEISFRTILASEPFNANALVGLARVHQARGNHRLAAATLLKAADYSPNSDLIVSELIAVQTSTSVSVVPETKIYEILARTTDKGIRAKLMFVMGNKLAADKEWSSAKSMFHVANELNPENPDIAYNYAVVLDYLGEQDRAENLYRSALRGALVQPSSFNHQVAESRANDLANR